MFITVIEVIDKFLLDVYTLQPWNFHNETLESQNSMTLYPKPNKSHPKKYKEKR